MRPLRATYRLQLRADWGFAAAVAQADYLARLGISHLYVSPIFEAAPGSTHGYDVVDHNRVSAALGGDAGWTGLLRATRDLELGVVVDIVPNHMGARVPDNAWWWDVLGHGPTSRFASFFDVDWDPNERRLRNLVLQPVLPDHAGRIIERGDLRLVREHGEVVVRYGDLVYPVSLPSLAQLVARAAFRDESPDGAELAKSLETPVGDGSQERRWFAELCERDPGMAGAVDAELDAVSHDPEQLDALLGQQHYRLSWWRTGNEELNYRRFLDITDLVALRAEDPEVFEASHALVLRWVDDGDIDGLRIDHPDGLRDPAGYFERLHANAPAASVFAEKVLADGEDLPEGWPISGTTGYDFLNHVGRLFVDPAGEDPLSRIYASFAGQWQSFAEVVYEARHELLASSLFADLRRLIEGLVGAAGRRRRVRDFTRRQIADAVTEILAVLLVYRTYVRAGPEGPSPADVATMRRAVHDAAEHRPDIDRELLDFLGDLLLLRTGDEDPACRAQQLSAGLAAKAVEDTACYRYLRLVSLNEVGGDPSVFGTTVGAFHRWCQHRQDHWPAALSATATHDMKRGEDHRLRVSVLSEIPSAWHEAISYWREINESHREGECPDANTEYLIYQTLIGSYPLSFARVSRYVRKAVREAKVHTSWLEPADDYEAGVDAFLRGILRDSRFTEALETFIGSIVPAARVSSLAQTLLKITCPGVPDFYQGSELWDERLVDPDNREPVDYAARRALLTAIERQAASDVRWQDDLGSAKLFVIQRALAARRERPDAFGPAGRYVPIPVTGAKADHLVAFTRAGEVAVLAPRLVRSLGGSWEDTAVALPAGRWEDAFTGIRRELPDGAVRVAELLDAFPVGLLLRERS